MQQTKNYKLNLIETSDTFSPAPLNENAEKTEAALAALHAADTVLTGAVAAAAAENCLVKLGGPLTAQVKAEELVFDLSGVDMGQFIALLFVGRSLGYAILKVNELEYRSAIHSDGSPNLGFALLMDNANGGIGVNSMYMATSTVGQQNISRYGCPLAEITKLTIYGEYAPGTCFSLYGIRA